MIVGVQRNSIPALAGQNWYFEPACSVGEAALKVQ